jgi:hypothetical protein
MQHGVQQVGCLGGAHAAKCLPATHVLHTSDPELAPWVSPDKASVIEACSLAGIAASSLQSTMWTWPCRVHVPPCAIGSSPASTHCLHLQPLRCRRCMPGALLSQWVGCLVQDLTLLWVRKVASPACAANARLKVLACGHQVWLCWLVGSVVLHLLPSLVAVAGVAFTGLGKCSSFL